VLREVNVGTFALVSVDGSPIHRGVFEVKITDNFIDKKKIVYQSFSLIPG
jgi:hypothetical protein